MPKASPAVSNPQTLSLTFTVPRRQPTHLTVEVKPNNDPERSGHHLIYPSQPFSTGNDFPTIAAKIHSPNSVGYAAIYGWIQVIREGHDAAAAAGAKWEMDLIPMTAHLNTRFAWFRPEAQLFDAPSRLQREDLDWTCWSVLTYVEDGLLSKRVRPVLALEWGFEIRDGGVTVKPLRLLGGDNAWEEQRGLLEGSFKGWEFLPLDEAVQVDEWAEEPKLDVE